MDDLVDENGEFKIFISSPSKEQQRENSEEEIQEEEEIINPRFEQKSKNKQLEVLLFSLRRERQKAQELNIKLTVLKKEFA